MNLPFFSIILPTYNRARLLPRAIQSLLTQNFQNWELWIADDGSEDETESLLQDYCLKDPRLHFIKTQRQGPARARNVVLPFCQGEFISFLDSDDEYLPNHLLSHYQLIQENPTVDFWNCDIEIIGNPFVPDKNNPKQKVHIRDCAHLVTFFIRRSCLVEVQGFPEMLYSEDSGLTNRLAEKKIYPLFSKLCTYRYYRNEADSICNLILSGKGFHVETTSK
ncbi:MAG: glycosyltransferase family 2 protein [Deltaproteobacteria bacterium]|nr:glycosyltransferase family 2 protein [Deltaproteobacteria bacterium]